MQVFVKVPSGKTLIFEFERDIITIGELKESVNWEEGTSYESIYMYDILLDDKIIISREIFGDRYIEIR